jgi:hypothetical protein
MTERQDWLILVPEDQEEAPSGRRYSPLTLHTQMYGTEEEVKAEVRRINGYWPDRLVHFVAGGLQHLEEAIIGERQCRVCGHPEISHDEAYWSLMEMGEDLCHRCRSWAHRALVEGILDGWAP